MKKILAPTSILVLFLFAQLSAQSQEWHYDWAKRLGGASPGQLFINAETHNTDIYLSGSFYGSIDFDPGTGIHQLTSTPEGDFFLAKYNLRGDLLWVKTMSGGAVGTNSVRDPNSINITRHGDIYISGRFQGYVDFDSDSTNSELLNSTDYSTFIAKYSSAGQLIWAKQISNIGGPSGSQVSQVRSEIDIYDNIYLTGRFTGTADFDPDTGVYALSAIGNQDMFILKLNSNGQFVYAKGIGSATNMAIGTAVGIDKSNKVFVGGNFLGAMDFNPGAGINMMTSKGHYDCFILQLDSAGNYVWSGQIGGGSVESLSDLKLDENDHLYLAGSFRSDSLFVDANGGSNFLSPAISNKTNGFVLKLDSTNTTIWAKNLGRTTNKVRIDRMKLGPDKGVFVAGEYRDSLILYNQIGVAQNTLNSIQGTDDAFLIYLDSLGESRWVYTVGDGLGNDVGWDILVSPDKSILFTGTFKGTVDFNPDSSSVNSLTSTGYGDFFMSKLNFGSLVSIKKKTFRENNFYVYPNPSFGSFTLYLKDFQEIIGISIKNIQGQEVYSTSQIPAEVIEIKFKGTAGIYFLEAIEKTGNRRRITLLKH